MKLPLIAFLAALFIAAGAQAQTTTTNSYFQLVNSAIPDDNPNGISSSINVSGVNGAISSISVTLDITNGYNGDLYGFLVNSNGGAFSVLLNRVGVQSGNAFGYSDSGFHVTLTDTAMNNLHFYQSGATRWMRAARSPEPGGRMAAKLTLPPIPRPWAVPARPRR